MITGINDSVGHEFEEEEEEEERIPFRKCNYKKCNINQQPNQPTHTDGSLPYITLSTDLSTDYTTSNQSTVSRHDSSTGMIHNQLNIPGKLTEQCDHFRRTPREIPRPLQ